MTPESVARHLDAIEAAVRESAEQISRLYGPAWAAKGDLAKIIVTIGSGLVAAMLAFSQDSLLDLPFWNFCVAIASLAGLLAAVVAAVYSLYSATELTAFQALQFNRRPYLREELAKLDEASPNLDDEIESLWRPLIESDTKRLDVAARRTEVSLKLAIGTFVGSLVGFVGLLLMRH